MVGRSILGRPEVVEISSTVGFCGFFCGTELLNVCTYYVEMHNINIYIYMYIYAYCYASYSILVYVYTLYTYIFSLYIYIYIIEYTGSHVYIYIYVYSNLCALLSSFVSSFFASKESAQHFHDVPTDPSELLEFRKRWPACNASAAFQHNHKDLLPI